MARILYGDVVVCKIKEQIKEDIRRLNTPLCLAVIIPMSSPANESYLRARKKLCEELGVRLKTFVFDGNEDADDLIRLVERLNADDEVQGVMIDTPFPEKLNAPEICGRIDYRKDVDGCSYVSDGRALQGEWSLVPSTAEGVYELLRYYGISLAGAKMTIVNSSRTVGLPLFNLAIRAGATATMCHKQTRDLVGACQNADIAVIAVGKAFYFDEKYFNKDSVVIDVGINCENNAICGDADRKIYSLVKAYSPVPKGVGPVTTVCLLKNLVKAAQAREKNSGI